MHALKCPGGIAPNMSRIAAILPAAGMGTRMGAETPKQFLELDGTPIVILSLRRIAACAQVTDIVLVHDAVRPFVTPEQIARVIEEARRCEAAILGIPAMDTVKEVKR